jgi:predicted DNA-binding protein (MmcQ/YjbR family)
MLLHQKGYLPAYHMNKVNWISVLLDGTATLNDIYSVIDFSFAATASKKKNVRYESLCEELGIQ